MKVEFTIPLRTKTGLNQREHWSARRRRVEAEKNATRWGFIGVAKSLGGTVPPYLVTLTRIGPREADDDNVVGGLKAVRDAVAEAMFLNDGDRKNIRFAYAQERGPWGVRVEIMTVESFAPAVAAGGGR